jgi:ElaB/YqjD/DUF883 family membrane-anchored ribosome-binding protein
MNRIEAAMNKSVELSDDVIGDFKQVVIDAEALIKATSDQGDDKLAMIRAKAEESLKVVKFRIVEAQAAMLAKTRAAAKVTDNYVHENPWEAIGVAASVGVVVGLLIGRR